mmetsp:Transcript_17161/g.19505  ORF Transcript_17161/g.19505 Transcript_17161/m.19505 type:complete len:280 (+) Transcript_17161:94-933(+)
MKHVSRANAQVLLLILFVSGLISRSTGAPVSQEQCESCCADIRDLLGRSFNEGDCNEGCDAEDIDDCGNEECRVGFGFLTVGLGALDDGEVFQCVDGVGSETPPPTFAPVEPPVEPPVAPPIDDNGDNNIDDNDNDNNASGLVVAAGVAGALVFSGLLVGVVVRKKRTGQGNNNVTHYPPPDHPSVRKKSWFGGFKFGDNHSVGGQSHGSWFGSMRIPRISTMLRLPPRHKDVDVDSIFESPASNGRGNVRSPMSSSGPFSGAGSVVTSGGLKTKRFDF